jgi:hypothetical protein
MCRCQDRNGIDGLWGMAHSCCGIWRGEVVECGRAKLWDVTCLHCGMWHVEVVGHGLAKLWDVAYLSFGVRRS